MDSQNISPLYGFLSLLSLMALVFMVDAFFTISTAERAVVERFRKFLRIVGPGLSMKIPLVDSVFKVDLRVQQLILLTETKTKDNVFVKIPVSSPPAVTLHILLRCMF